MLEIIQKNKIDDWKHLVKEFLEKKHDITSAKEHRQNIKRRNQLFKEKIRIAFVAYLDDKACGFIIGKLEEGDVLEVVTFYPQEQGFDYNVGSELVNALAQKAFDIGYKYFRMYLQDTKNYGPSFNEGLEAANFKIIPRAGMTLDLESIEKEDITLPEGYSFQPIKPDIIDNMFEVIVGSMTEDHLDVLIYPSMKDSKQMKELFAKFTNNFEMLNPSFNPQLMYNDTVVGASFVGAFDKEKTFIMEVGLLLDHQGKGLGKALMKKIIQNSINAGYKKIGLAVTKDNIAAYKLYQKLGFVVHNNTIAIIKHNK